MKIFGLLFTFLLAFIMVFTACTPVGTDIEENTKDTNKDSTTPTAPANPEPEDKTIKVLAIGNSFSVDAMEHLAIILKDAGYDEIVLGDLYIGGCSLDTHSSNIRTESRIYTFYVNEGDGWSFSTTDIQAGINYADWDIITIQQVSQDSGRPETFGKLQNIIDYVKGIHSDAKIYWHMTWAYEASSSHEGFANYDNNQMTMYNAITNTVKTNILTNTSIDGVIPSGTAVQNLRVTYGDSLTRDGFHLTNGIGRYTAALMWYKQLTGGDISGITAIPADYPEIEEHLSQIKDAVNNAYAKPLEVTDNSEKIA